MSVMTSRYSTKCARCGKPIARGESMFYCGKHYPRGQRTLCLSCADRASSSASSGQRDERDPQRDGRQPIIPPTPTAMPGAERASSVLELDYRSICELMADAERFGEAAYTANIPTVDGHVRDAAGRSRFYNGYTWDTLRACVANPPAHLTAAVDELKRQIESAVDLPLAKRRRIRRGLDYGDDIDAGRYARRDPCCWSAVVREQAPKPVVTIGVNVTVHYKRMPHELLYRGAAAAALADCLTDAGYSVEILAFQVVDELSAGTPRLVQKVTVKAPDAALDISAVALLKGVRHESTNRVASRDRVLVRGCVGVGDSAAPVRRKGDHAMTLAEKYRPRTLAELVGQERAIATLKRVLDRPGFDGDAFWIVGPSGTGKTSLAWIIARMFAKCDCDITELDGEACTVDAVRGAASMMRYAALGGGFRAWIINEAQAMTPRAVQAWLTTLDKLPPRVLVIFTTTADSEDLFGEYAGPFRSRCKTIAFTKQGLAEPFAARAQEIARAEGLDGYSEAAYLRLVQKCRNNLRAVLQAIEAGEMVE